jgi:hypothetical protein
MGCDPFAAAHQRNQPARDALTSVMNALTIGDLREPAQRTVESRLRPELRFDRSHPHLWTVRMPFETRATDWMVLIDFEQDRVSGVRMRTSDGMDERHKPKEAPPDKP